MHPFSTLTVFRCFQGAEKGCIGIKWVKMNNENTRAMHGSEASVHRFSLE